MGISYAVNSLVPARVPCIVGKLTVTNNGSEDRFAVLLNLNFMPPLTGPLERPPSTAVLSDRITPGSTWSMKPSNSYTGTLFNRGLVVCIFGVDSQTLPNQPRFDVLAPADCDVYFEISPLPS